MYFPEQFKKPFPPLGAHLAHKAEKIRTGPGFLGSVLLLCLLSAEHNVRYALRGLGFGLLDHMGVDVPRGADLGVAQPLTNTHAVYAVKI